MAKEKQLSLDFDKIDEEKEINWKEVLKGPAANLDYRYARDMGLQSYTRSSTCFDCGSRLCPPLHITQYLQPPRASYSPVWGLTEVGPSDVGELVIEHRTYCRECARKIGVIIPDGYNLTEEEFTIEYRRRFDEFLRQSLYNDIHYGSQSYSSYISGR